jgi:hypothetical protein
VVTATAAPAGATPSNATATTGSTGSAGFSGLTLTGTPGSYTLSFEATGLTPASSGTITLSAAATTTTIIGHAPDPSVVAEAIAVTFTVTSPGGTPTGDVTVSDGTVDCTGTVAERGCTLTPITPGDKTLKATYAGDANFAGSTSEGVAHTVTAFGTPSGSRSSVTAAPSLITASSGESESTITVTVRDDFGNPVSDATVTLSATGTGNTLTASGTTDTDGHMTGTFRSTAAETKTISARVDNAVTITETASVTVDPAAASDLTFKVQPRDLNVGDAITPAVVVAALDPFGNTATGFAGDVVIAIGRDGSLSQDAQLTGTIPVAAASGVASFDDLSINRAGVGYTLVASAAGAIRSATSDPFTVISLTP